MYDKPAVYEEGASVIYRASSLGNCIGALVRARLGVTGSPPPDAMLERYAEGHEYEATVLQRGLGVDWLEVTSTDNLALFGKVVVDPATNRNQVETEIAWGNKVVRCHPDGVVTRGSTLEQFVCEVKFLGPDMFREARDDFDAFLTAHPSYKWQAAIEMLSTGLPLLYVVGEKDIVEVEGERVLRGVGEVLTTEVTTPPFNLVDVKMRIAEVEGWVARGEMPACPLPLMYPCAYWADHQVDEKPVIDDDVLKEWIGVWRLAKKASDTAAKDLEFARGAVMEQMHELHLTSGVCDGVNLTVTPASEKGNVSWASAYKALAKQTGERVDEDEYRGKAKAGYITITEVGDA